jgi:hypothetical protein
VNTFLKNKLKLAKEFAAHANLDAAGAKAFPCCSSSKIGHRVMMDQWQSMMAI